MFDDIYFDSTEGILESEYVYCDGVNLNEAILKRTPQITVGEIGFGVGLNFLLTCKRFIENANSEQRLTYIAAEKHPVIKEHLAELYLRFPELQTIGQILLDQYPLLTPGFHWIRFPSIPVSLLLLFGDATQLFSQLEAQVDYWYWDGFSPAKNPDAFSESCFSEVARLSAKGATGASFSSAGWVRRGLEKNGFQVTKRVGFGRKRECITATFTGSPSSKLPPWYSNQQPIPKLLPNQTRVGVIGAGLAGSAIANSLVHRGFDVQVIDQTGVAQKASGNAAGLFDLQLSRIPSPLSRFAQLSLAHFLRELKETTAAASIQHRFGLTRESPEVLECLKSGEFPPSFFSIQNSSLGRIDFPFCGIVNPLDLCHYRLQGCTVHLHKKVTTVHRKDSTFELLDSEGKVITEVDQLVYASGADSLPLLSDLTSYPLKSVRGQTLRVHPTLESERLDSTLVHQGYATPAISFHSARPFHLIGATYQGKTIHTDQLERDTETLLTESKRKWIPFKDLNSESVIDAREGFRLSTPDKLPLIGPHCDPNWMKTHYEKMLQGHAPRHAPAPPPLQMVPNTWIFLAFGSRGITFTSYGAEILAQQMTGETLPVERDLWSHLHSARFFVRNLKRHEID